MLERRKIDTGTIPDVVAAKWSRDVLDEGFVPLPKRLVRSLVDLFSGPHAMQHLAVVLAIVDYKRPQLSRPPSVEYLAFTANMPVEEFKKYVSDLEAVDYVKVSGSDDAYDVQIDGLLDALRESTGGAADAKIGPEQ